jgi:hypothetical protein
MARPRATMADMANARAAVQAGYREYLGRDASDEEINGQLGGGTLWRPENVNHAVNNLRVAGTQAGLTPRSAAAAPTARTADFRDANGNGRDDRDEPGAAPASPKYTPENQVVAGDTTPRTFGTAPYTDRGSGTGAAGWNYSGFDFNQDANNRLIGKSAKYTLADATRVAAEKGASADMWKTKAGAQEFAELYLRDYLQQNGFEVLDIIGDKMFIRDHEDRAAGRPGSWVDFVIGADGDNPSLGFQVEQQRAAFGPVDRYAPTPTRGTPAAPGSTATPAVGGVNPQAYRELVGDPNDPGYYPRTLADMVP